MAPQITDNKKDLNCEIILYPFHPSTPSSAERSRSSLKISKCAENIQLKKILLN